MKLFEHYSTEFARLQSALPDAEPRKDSLAQLQQQGFPHGRDEAWRDTALGDVLDTGYSGTGKPDDATLAAVKARLAEFSQLLPDAINLVLVNGWYIAALSDSALPAENLSLKSGGKMAIRDKTAFTLLNDIFAGESLQLQVHGELSRPLHLCYVSYCDNAPLLSCPRVSISLDAGARADIVESHITVNANAADNKASGFNNCVLQLDLAKASKASYVSMQWDQGMANQFNLLQATQEEDSRLLAVAVSPGATSARRELGVQLQGARAACELRGLYVLGAKSNMDFRTKVVHASANTDSEQLVLGLLQDKAKSMFHGHLVIDKDAQKVEAHQKNENLVLNDGATAGSQPMLEIHADDVKCSHGASVGSFAEDAIFSLRTRGLDQPAAERILAEGFFNRVLSVVEQQQLHDGIRNHLSLEGN